MALSDGSVCDWCELPIEGTRWRCYLSHEAPRHRQSLFESPVSATLRAMGEGFSEAVKAEREPIAYYFHPECWRALDEIIASKLRS